MALEEDLAYHGGLALDRLLELVFAPLQNQEMLWAAVPLLIATIFITLYFGRYKKEELGWNTAFGNTMVFLFVAISLIRQMYYLDGAGSWDNVTSNGFYFLLSGGLVFAGVFLMLVTYFHLLPKKLAFFLFSAPPINVSVYVVMSAVYAKVQLDAYTVMAGFLMLIGIVVFAKLLQLLIGLEEKTPGISGFGGGTITFGKESGKGFPPPPLRKF